MKLPFFLRFAWREGRSGGRSLGLHFAAIAIGVGTLVALHGFRSDVERAVQRESRALLGADLRLGGRQPLPEEVRAVVDSLEAAGAERARTTALLSMVLAPGPDRARLLQLRAVEGSFPFYGELEVRPSGAWEAMEEGRGVLVEEPALIQLGIEVGERVRVGTVELPVVGTVAGLPPEVALQTAAGPRVLVAPGVLDRSGLVTTGSRVWYWTYLALSEEGDAERLQRRYRELFRSTDVDDDSAAERARSLTRGVSALSRFLALVGVVALVLGGIGVASAVHAYVAGKVDGVAVLRCLGATQDRVFGAYLAQAGALSFLGAGAGGLLGAGVQWLLPTLLEPVLPVPVEPRLHLPALAAGVGIGVWAGVAFALLPLLAVRDVPPLRAFRHGFEEEGEGGPAGPGAFGARAAVLGLLGATVLGLCLWQAPTRRVGLGFAGGLTGALLLLAATAWVLARTARALLPPRGAYPLRLGISNLFRPRNQTLAVTLTIGAGAFLLAAIVGVQGSLSDRFGIGTEGEGPDLLLFDVLPDQEEGVLRILEEGGASFVDGAPVVPARLSVVSGRSVEEIRDEPRGERPPRWTLNRTYRNTYREHPTDTEEVVAGRWWSGPWRGDGLPEISVEEEVAQELGVSLGDRIVWDVEGREVETVITSLRGVEWAQLRPNFFVVFQPGVLEEDPRSSVFLARAPGADVRARLQARLAERFPNLSALDISRLRKTVEGLLSSVRRTVVFLAALSVVAGGLVLLGSLAATRGQRLRESALLRTLGARRRQLRGVLASEAAVLGVVAGTVGVGLGAVAGGLLVRFLFEMPYRPSGWALLALWAGVAALTTAAGLLGTRSLLDRPPLPVLRRAAE